MLRKNINIKVFITLAMFILLMYTGNAQSNDNNIKKNANMEKLAATKDSLAHCAYRLFNDKILRDYLYVKDGNVMHRRWHTFYDMTGKGFIKYYDMFSKKHGNNDARLFWSLVQDGAFTEIYNTKNCIVANQGDNNVIFADYAVDVRNGAKDTCNVAYNFGNNYIDLKNEHVAKHIDEIKQICKVMKQIQKTERRANHLKQSKTVNTR